MGYATGDFDANHGHRMPMWERDYARVRQTRRLVGSKIADWHPENGRQQGVNRRDHRRHAMRFSRAKASGS